MNAQATEHYDFFVIGGGSGGVRASRIAAGHGAKVGLAESDRLGGTCVNVGCVPKKLMAYAADFGGAFEDAKAYGWKSGKLTFDWQTLVANKDKEIARLNGIYENLLKNAGVDLHRGHAKFIDDKTIDIDGKIITADKILIATGGKPFIPPIPGSQHIKSSDDMFALPQAPKHIAIIGGGYIAVEFARIFSGTGTEVTLLHRGDKILRGFDEDVRDFLAEEMNKQKNVTVKLHSDVTKVEEKGGNYVVHTSTGDKVKCDMILGATGRTPLTAPLDLAKAGVKTLPDGRIEVNDDYVTCVPHIFAIGDVCSKHNLTPVALAEGHVLADRLFAQKNRHVEYEFIATAVFSSPPVATVGYGEHGAQAKGYDVEVYKTSFRPLKHTVSGRDERTFMKLIVDKKTDRVIGAHMVGADAPEIMQGIAIAINAGATKAAFDRTIGIHPTAAEEFVTMRTPVKPK